jgi:hypothetical protein
MLENGIMLFIYRRPEALVTKLCFVTHFRAKLRFAWAGCRRVGDAGL